MGKTKYAAAVVAAKVSQTSGAQSVNTEAMPEVAKASALLGSPRAKKVDTRKADADAHLCVYKVGSDAMIYKDDQGVCLFPGIDTISYASVSTDWLQFFWQDGSDARRQRA